MGRKSFFDPEGLREDGPRASLWMSLALVGCLAANLAADQFVKYLAVMYLKGQEAQGFLWNTVVLVYAENEGAFLGAFGSVDPLIKDVLLKFLPLAACLAASVWMIMSRKLMTLERFLVASIIGGGLANLIDRFMYGKVVDYLNFGIGPVRTGILNLADMSVTFGVAILVIIQLRQGRKKR